jgi:hypothetical protein
MAAAAIGGRVLAHLLENHISYLKCLFSQLQQILAAPAEIVEMTRQIKALCICFELLLEQVLTPDSIINTDASGEVDAIKSFLDDCSGCLNIVMDMIQKHASSLPDGRKTWSNTFRQTYKNFKWTRDRGNIGALVQKINSDLETVTKITGAIQR